MSTNSSIYTIGQYLQGKIRNVTVPDEALIAICADAGVDPDDLFVDLTVQQREIALAWLYVWMAGSPTQSGGFTEEDADWRSSDGGERMSANVLKQYLTMANKIFEKYELATISSGTWGFVGRGIKHIRRN